MRCSSSLAGASLAVVSNPLHVHAMCCAAHRCSSPFYVHQAGPWAVPVVHQERPLTALPCASMLLGMQ